VHVNQWQPADGARLATKLDLFGQVRHALAGDFFLLDGAWI
jgi:hypothetical protein